jgi:hypothetical protein
MALNSDYVWALRHKFGEIDPSKISPLSPLKKSLQEKRPVIAKT